MDDAHNAHETMADADDSLDPQEAARLLERTGRDARRQLTTQTPLLSLISALLILVIYGAIWLSTRGQDPYRGPSLGTVGLVYLLVTVTVLVSAAVYVRATAGVKGRSRREDRITAMSVLVAVVGVYVFDGALKYDGFGNAIVYGVFDAAAPWLTVGAVMAGLAAAREDWWKLAGAIAVIVIGVGSVFAGPINVWGVLAVSGCLMLLGQAALRLLSSRHA